MFTLSVYVEINTVNYFKDTLLGILILALIYNLAILECEV